MSEINKDWFDEKLDSHTLGKQLYTDYFKKRMEKLITDNSSNQYKQESFIRILDRKIKK